MATPHVTGVVALLYAQDPTSDWRVIRNKILAGDGTAAAQNTTITGRRTFTLWHPIFRCWCGFQI